MRSQPHVLDWMESSSRRLVAQLGRCPSTEPVESLLLLLGFRLLPLLLLGFFLLILLGFFLLILLGFLLLLLLKVFFFLFF